MVHRGRDGALKPALVALACIAVVSAVIQNHVPALGTDGGRHLPVEFIASKSVFGAGWLGHHRAVRLAKFVGLNAVFIEKEQIDGVIDHDDLNLVHITGLKQTEVNNHANIRVNVQSWGKTCSVLAEAGRSCSTFIGLRPDWNSEQKQHKSPCCQPTHGGSILAVHFNDWVGCSPAANPRFPTSGESNRHHRQPPNGRCRSVPPPPHRQRRSWPRLQMSSNS